MPSELWSIWTWLWNIVNANESGTHGVVYNTLILFPFLHRYAASLMGAEEIHVDNFLFTSDSNQVVTGSIYGPPQVWDMTVSVTVTKW